jgi:hypothetical protein
LDANDSALVFSLKSDALPACEQSALVNEAELVTKWVGAIETAFSPWLCLNWPKNGAILLLAYPDLARLKIVYREVNMVWIGRRVPGVAVGTGIETREDGSTAIEIVPPGRDPHSRLR